MSFSVNANRFYIQPFTPIAVTVADGYLQITLPNPINSTICNNKTTVVLPDNHKYFEAYLSLATTAFVANKKINVAISEPCIGGPGWFQISNVMQLVN